MKKAITLLAVILFIVAGCGGGNQSGTQSDGFITVDVTASYPKKELILQDFMDVEYVPLETSDEFITSAQILTVGKEIIVFRNIRRGGAFGDGDLFLFDINTGKGLRKINRLGQGPEEYTNAAGVVINEDNDEMIVNNTYASKVLVYDLLGNFKWSFNQSKDFFFNQIGDLDKNNLICYDIATELINNGLKSNYFSIVSKKDGSIKEIQIPYKEKKLLNVYETDENGSVSIRSSIWNRTLIPHRDSWILVEPSADTIYSLSSNHTMEPFIVRTPSVQSMNPEVFLFPGVLTDRYYFMQTVKKMFDPDTGFPSTDLMYDRQENTIFECVVYNDDYSKKRPMSLAYETPMFAFGNNEIAVIRKLEAHELVEAYEKGELKGKLKEVAATLEEESNAVLMLAKYKK